MGEDKNINWKNNSWGVIRLICAVSIMLSHYYVQIWAGDLIPMRPFLYAGSSMCILFILSGFLIGPSVLRHSKIEFIQKRILRLFPVYYVYMVLAVILVVACNKNVEIKHIFEWVVKNMFFLFQTDLYGIKNGPVWAIFIQIQFYLLLMVVYRFLYKVENKIIWIIIFIFLVFLNLITETLVDNGITWYKRTLFPYMYYFFIGMYASRFFDSVVLFCRKWAVLFLVLHFFWHIGCIEFPLPYQYADPISVLTIAIAIIGFAYYLPTGFSMSRDLSYDIFIWHMPVLTFLKHYTSLEGNTIFACGVFVTILFSYITNICVEKRLLKR